MKQGEIVADIDVQIKILRQGRLFGYEIMIGKNAITGWSSREGHALQSGLHAWRTALRHCKDQSPHVPGLYQITQIM